MGTKTEKKASVERAMVTVEVKFISGVSESGKEWTMIVFPDVTHGGMLFKSCSSIGSKIVSI